MSGPKKARKTLPRIDALVRPSGANRETVRRDLEYVRAGVERLIAATDDPSPKVAALASEIATLVRSLELTERVAQRDRIAVQRGDLAVIDAADWIAIAFEFHHSPDDVIVLLRQVFGDLTDRQIAAVRSFKPTEATSHDNALALMSRVLDAAPVRGALARERRGLRVLQEARAFSRATGRAQPEGLSALRVLSTVFRRWNAKRTEESSVSRK